MVSLTPFTEDGDLDEPGLRAHLRRLGVAGIGVYLAGSGSGEGYTLTRDERRRVFDVGVEELARSGAGAGHGRGAAHRGRGGRASPRTR